MNIAGASSLLLISSAVLRERSIGKQKRQGAEEKTFMGTFSR